MTGSDGRNDISESGGATAAGEDEATEASRAPGDGHVSPSAENVDGTLAGGGGGPEDESTRLEEELAEARDRHLRLAAEFENYRKRTRAEMLQSGTRAQARLIGSLLDVLDDFDRIVDMDPDEVSAEAVIEGAQLVERKLKRVLDDAGVERIDPEGDPFDPERMEAVMREPADSEDEDDLVSRVFQRGVMFKGQLVRPARVAVRKFE